jgi:NAD(P)H-flavin reductase
MLPSLARVTAVKLEAPLVHTFEIVPEDAGVWPGFSPGQFTMLSVFGVGEVPVSVSGPPRERRRIVHTVRAVGPVSEALARLQPGDYLGLRGPYGNHWPLERAAGKDVLVIAGGLGLAPVRPIVYELVAERARYRRASLLYGTRGPEDILFADEYAAWRDAGIDVQVTVDHAGADWHGHVGLVTLLIEKAGFDPANTIAFVCGPEIMMRFAGKTLLDAGVAGTDIFVSLERNMKCAVGLCGHCQLGPLVVCRDGAVFDFAQAGKLLATKEL